jgi:S-layer protein (TIGR01567 family)
MLILLLGLVIFSSAQDAAEAAYVRGHFSYGDGIWRASDFGWFYYDLDKDLGGEELKIDLNGRTAEKGHIVYSSKVWDKEFEYEPWGSFQAVGFLGKPYLAGYHNSSLTDEVNILEDGQLMQVLRDEDRTQILSYNSTLSLEQGYVLTLAGVSEKKGTVNFLLLKNGQPEFSSLVSNGDTFVYKVRDVPVIMVHLSHVMWGDEYHGLVEVDGVFQISDTPYIRLFEGGLLGNMKLTDYSETGMVFENNQTMNLRRDSILPLTAELQLVVLDDPDLVYYPQGGLFDYGVHVIRGPVFNASSSIPVRMGDYNSSVVARWNAQNYTGFYFDPENSLGSETLVFYSVQGRRLEQPTSPRVYQQNRTVFQSGLQYNTFLQAKEFEYRPWGHYFIISLFGAPWFAGYNSSLEGNSAPKSLLENEYLGRILMDMELQGSILAGSYPLQEGYECRIQDVGNDSLFLQLMKDNSQVDSAVIKSNTTYIYKKDLGDVDDLPIIMMHFGNIFHNETQSFVTLEGIFQISDQFILPVEPGTGFGELEIVLVRPGQIISVNNDGINLNSNSNVNIGPGMDIRVADNDTLRYYLYTSKYVVPSPEPPLINYQKDVSSSASANFSMLVRAAEIRNVLVNILDSSNKTVYARDITSLAQGSGDLWGYAWRWNATTRRISDDNSLILDTGRSPVMALLYLNKSAPPRQVGVIFDSGGRIVSIMDGTTSYYISRGEYATLNKPLDYDAMMNSSSTQMEFFKIQPGESILQFVDLINNQWVPSGINHTLQGDMQAIEPHAIIFGAEPGRYELRVRVENSINAIWATDTFFNVTGTGVSMPENVSNGTINITEIRETEKETEKSPAQSLLYSLVVLAAAACSRRRS